MDFTQFYRLSVDIKGRPLEASAVDLSLDDQLATTHGLRRALEPVRMQRRVGQQALDQLETPGTCLRIFSKKFFEVLEAENFTGWDRYPVVLEGTQQDQYLNHYFGLVITGRSGPLDISQAVQGTALPAVPGGRPSPALYGYAFAPESWDGSDIFCPAGTGGLILVHQRVRDALLRAKMSNIVFERMDRIRWLGKRARKSVESFD